MNFWKSVDGMVKGELTGAEPGETLHVINRKGIQLYRVEWADELTVIFRCSRRDQHIIAEICSKRGDSVRFSDAMGIFYHMKSFIHRPVLMTGCLVLLFLTLFLPTRVLFFQVDGNENIPAKQILETARECGIRFGISRRAVRSEKMKNALLVAMPELKWAGINTAGCTAVISVREGEMQEEKTLSTGVSSVVAARDGYITSCTVTRGNALCTPGQVVQEGQVLISGYTDCGICIQVTEAAGEVQANTSRNFCAVTPSEHTVRTEPKETSRRFSLIFGKKRINLWKGSGISPATCGRMYEEYYITLPGGFQLPVCLSVETLTDWDTTVMEIRPERAEDELSAFARTAVLNQTVAGSILRESLTMEQIDGVFVLGGSFLCSEMIGRVITEEIGETNGKNS